MTINIDRPFTVGEVPASLLYTFKDDAGEPVNLGGYSITFSWRHRDTPRADADNMPAALAGDGSDGEVEYEWDGLEFSTVGVHEGEFVATNVTNTFVSELIRWTVHDAVYVPDLGP
jgi:hypothetical protein